MRRMPGLVDTSPSPPGVPKFAQSLPSPLDTSWQPVFSCFPLYMPTHPRTESQEICCLAPTKRMKRKDVCLSVRGRDLPGSEKDPDVQSCGFQDYLLPGLKGTRASIGSLCPYQAFLSSRGCPHSRSLNSIVKYLPQA